MVNSHLVCYPTLRQLGFDLPRQQWSPLNCFRTEQGHCGACRRKWRLTDTDLSLWRDPDDVSHCRILSPDKTEWRLISATLCEWRRCFVVDQLWFMTRIREDCNIHTTLFTCDWQMHVRKMYLDNINKVMNSLLNTNYKVVVCPTYSVHVPHCWQCVIRYLQEIYTFYTMSTTNKSNYNNDHSETLRHFIT